MLYTLLPRSCTMYTHREREREREKIQKEHWAFKRPFEGMTTAVEIRIGSQSYIEAKNQNKKRETHFET